MRSCSTSYLPAAEELWTRRQARRNLIDFTVYTYPQYRAEPAHSLIAGHLDAVVRGEITRLMIFAPPQHGKSELASVRLPAFWLGQRADDPVILASYGAHLAENMSRRARQVVEGGEYTNLFPAIKTQGDSRAVNHWFIAGHRGSMLAAGVGGPITGHGALLGIIDDPFENWEQAHSETIREKTWEWYRYTFRPRIWENGAIVLIMTRWHEDDLAGRLLQLQAGEWVVLRLPALAETQEDRDHRNKRLNLVTGQSDPLDRDPGEPLCPKRFSLPALMKLKADVGSLAWAAEYAGCPTLPEGNMFKRAWFQIVDAAPATVVLRVRYWDKAATRGGGARTAGVLMALGPDDLVYVEDVGKGQWSPAERDAVMKQTAILDQQRYGTSPCIWVEQEPGSGGKESAEASIRLLKGFPVQVEAVSGSKEVRAEPLRAYAEAGNIRLVRGAWNGDYIEELCAFPNGAYADQVDASSGAFNKLALGDGEVPQVVYLDLYQEISPF